MCVCTFFYPVNYKTILKKIIKLSLGLTQW